MAIQSASDTLTAPAVYRRSDYHDAGGPYVIGCHGGRTPVEDWAVWWLTVDIQQMRPIVEKVETKSAAMNTKYAWEIKQMYGADTLWHQDSGYGLTLQHGQNGADTIVVLDQSKEYSMPLWLIRGTATWETAYRPEDIYSIQPKNIEGVSERSCFCCEKSYVIRLSFYEGNTIDTNYRKAKDHQQQWVIKSCGDTQREVLGKLDQLEKVKAEAEGKHQQAVSDLAAAEARLDATAKERDDARMDASKTGLDAQKQKIKDLRAQLGEAQTNADSAASKLADQEAACASEKERLKSKLDKALGDRDRLKQEKADAEDAQHTAETAKDQAEKEKAALQDEKDKLQKTSDAASKADAEQRTKAKSDQEALQSQLQDERKAQKARDKEIENLKESLAEKEADEKAAREAQKAAEAARDAAVDESKKREKESVDGKNKDAQTIEALQAEKEDRAKKLADCRRDGVKNGKELDRLTRERPELIRRAEEADEDAKKAREQLENAKKKRRDAEDQLADEKDRIADLQRDLDDAKKELEALKKEEKRKAKKKDKDAKDLPDEKAPGETPVEGAARDAGTANGKTPVGAQAGTDATDATEPVYPGSNLPNTAEPGKEATNPDSGKSSNVQPGSNKPSIEDQIKGLQDDMARQKKEIDDLKAGKKPDEQAPAIDNKPNPGRSDMNAPGKRAEPENNPSSNAPNPGAANPGPRGTQSNGQAPVAPITTQAPQPSSSNQPRPDDSGSTQKPDVVPGSNNPGAQQPGNGTATAKQPQPPTGPPAESGESQPVMNMPSEGQNQPSTKPTSEPTQPANDRDEDLKKQLADMGDQLKKMQEQLDKQQNKGPGTESTEPAQADPKQTTAGPNGTAQPEPAGSEAQQPNSGPQTQSPTQPGATDQLSPKTEREEVVDKETKDILDSLMSPTKETPPETCTDRCPTCKRTFSD
ncbi:hypothetical protein HII31_10328 [Pseudocercospora fuligena]|uniref:Uncharacterized protein n=1 Tax=Pseudocercospora fuligena TaxID=685502 RepID=A0A8H6VHG8_9PEZI|nr:hypothetical protein HII31_10328 [Pseudocercospora fuligena]